MALAGVNSTLAELADIASKTNLSLDDEFETGKFEVKPTKRAYHRKPKEQVAETKTEQVSHSKESAKSDSRLGRRNYGNSKTLRETCWEILERDPSTYSEYIPDYPENATGLKISELKTIIEEEGEWVSSSSDIGIQIQNALYNLKNKEGKLHRNDEDRRYYIIEGKNLND